MSPRPPRRHRPTYVLFLPGVPAIATCDCHLGRPVRYDRPLPLPEPTPVLVHGERRTFGNAS